jgi:hypothetical protein
MVVIVFYNRCPGKWIINIRFLISPHSMRKDKRAHPGKDEA